MHYHRLKLKSLAALLALIGFGACSKEEPVPDYPVLYGPPVDRLEPQPQPQTPASEDLQGGTAGETSSENS